MRAEREGRPSVLARDPLLELLETGGTSPDWQVLDASARRGLIAAAVLREIERANERQPLLVVIEDAQRTDTATIDLIGAFANLASRLRVLLIVSFRADFRHPWAGREGYAEIRLEPLGVLETEELVASRIGDAAVPRLRRMLLDWSAGNPLFLSESIRSLIESGVIAGPPGAHVLSGELTRIDPPASIKAIISERVDSPPTQTKETLLAASVLGEWFSPGTLARLTSRTEAAIGAHLRRLSEAGYLRALASGRQEGFAFAHTMFQEVCYSILLRRQRREIHAAAFAALVSAPTDSEERAIERLAYHAFNGQLWNDALTYCRLAGRRAAARSANREAADHLENAIAALDHVDP